MKAKENIIFAMAALSMEERMLLSNGKRELLHKCSFNGKACDIDKQVKKTPRTNSFNLVIF